MHPQVNKFLLYELMSADEFRDIFDDLLIKDIIYIFKGKEQATGMFKLVPYTHRSSHIAYLGGLAIHPSHSGKGLGSIMMKEILNYAKQEGFLRIELSAATINDKAIRLYEKAGFQKEGILRKYTHLKKGDLYLDEVLMAWVSE